MQDVVICDPVRSPVGRFGGAFKSLSAAQLGAQIVSGLVDRTRLPPEAVDDVIFANCYPSMDAPALGRVAGLDAGLPIGAGGLQIDRRCGSGLQAVIYAIMQVGSGGSELVIAGGAESMSNAPFFSHEGRWGAGGAPALAFHDSLAKGRVTAGGATYPVAGGMLETAENLRREYAITREAQDELALASQMRADAAIAAEKFVDEIVPVVVKTKKGERIVSQDEHPRADTTLEELAKLKPIRLGIDEDATVTAGNASGQNDGAAACIVTTRRTADALGLSARLTLKSWSLAGVEPHRMGIGPVPATAKALERAGLTLADMDLIELNEAFAAQVLACTAEWGLSPGDFARLNVNGSGIALGHPVGATGGRILATLSHELDRREARYGLEAMCIGGGQGLAAVFERVQ